ncbi:MAG: hypothetical protein HAW66_08080 [Shewanella sp.]|nr:hypothetical protein [Shewanella sp.]
MLVSAATTVRSVDFDDKELQAQHNLIQAVKDEDYSEVEMLLTFHSNLSVDILVDDEEPLIILAAKTSNLDALILFLQKSKDPTICDRHGMNVIHHLLFSPHADCCYHYSMDAALIAAIERGVSFTQTTDSGEVAIIKLFEYDFFKLCTGSRALALSKVSKDELWELKINGTELVDYIDNNYSNFSVEGVECLINAGFNLFNKTMLGMTLQESLYSQLDLIQKMPRKERERFVMNLDGIKLSGFEAFKTHTETIIKLIDRRTLNLSEYTPLNTWPCSYQASSKEKATYEAGGFSSTGRRRSMSSTEIKYFPPKENSPEVYHPYASEPEPDRQKKLAQDDNCLTWTANIFTLSPPAVKNKWNSTPNLHVENPSEKVLALMHSAKSAATTFLIEISKKLHGRESEQEMVLVEHMEIGGVTIFSGHIGEFRTNYLPLLEVKKKQHSHRPPRSGNIAKVSIRAQRQHATITKAQIELRKDFKDQVNTKRNLDPDIRRRSITLPSASSYNALSFSSSPASPNTFDSVFSDEKTNTPSDQFLYDPRGRRESQACLTVANTFKSLSEVKASARRTKILIPTISFIEVKGEIHAQRKMAFESAKALKGLTGQLQGPARHKSITEELKGVRVHAMSGIADATDDYTDWLQRLDIEAHMDCESTTIFHGIELAAGVLTQIDSIRQLKTKEIKDIIGPLSGLTSGVLGAGAAVTEISAHFSEGSISDAVGDASASLEIIGALKDGMIKIIDLIKELSHSGRLTQSDDYAPTNLDKTDYYLGEGLSYAKTLASISKKFMSASKKIIDVVGTNSGALGDLVPGLGLVVSLINIAEQIQKLTKSVPLYMQLSEMKLRAKVLLCDTLQTEQIISSNGKTNTAELKAFLELPPETESELYGEIIDPDAIDEVRRYALVRELKAVNLDRIKNECFLIALNISKTCANITELSVVAEEVAIALTVTNAVVEIGKVMVEGGVQKVHNYVHDDHSVTHKHEILCQDIEILLDLTAMVYNDNTHLVDRNLLERQTAEVDILYKSTGLPFDRFIKLLKVSERKAVRALYTAIKSHK